MITIKNEHITASFATLGAELKSFVYKGIEYIWPGNEKSWKGSAPILFPIQLSPVEELFANNPSLSLQY